jgi:succinoglycan biosynthesis protein ExoA
VIDNPGRIVSTGLNSAIKAARGEIVVRMDAHTEYAPDYVQQCVAVLQETGADNVGGPARTRAETYLEKAVAAAYHSRFAVGGARFHDVNYEGWVDTVTYGCWRREAFDRFGYFDEELVRNQDDEHNLRIIRDGGKIWQSPKIRSWYRPRGSLSALFKQYMQYGYWKVRVIQKHKLPASWRHLVPGAFVLALLVLILLSAFCFLLSPFAEVPSSQGPRVPGSFGPLVPSSLSAPCS